ncbi:MAG: MarR family transcriptional regulator [Chloroflexi bacterium]|nr:MarR family transcriptional regulator [Chloroflexota bacterium]
MSPTDTADNFAEKQHFAEEVGLFFERSGMTRMAGRILGWLLVCDPPHQTLNDLAEALQASKGSISGMTRFLIHMGLIERFSLPGERRDYFRVRADAWYFAMESGLAEITRAREIAERGLQLLDDENPASQKRLEEMRDIYTFFEREIPLILARWKQDRSA